MSTTITQFEENLSAMMHGGTLNKVRNRYALYERVANTVLTRLDPLETMRLTALTQSVHDDLNDYALPSDYKKLIDIFPVEDRTSSERGARVYAEPFAAELAVRNQQLTIESKEGVKYIRLNWKDKGAKTIHTMDSLTTNGTIAIVGTASGLKATTLHKLSGSSSIEFDSAASGDGIQCTDFTDVDLTDWDEQADFIVPVYFGSVSNITSVSFIFGNDLTTNYWTCVAQTTQSDGTAFRVGWNYLLFPWSTATESGTVVPSTIDCFKLTIATSGAVSNIRVDNILASLGRFFDIKYYSQYSFKDSVGTWLSKPTADTDSVVLIGTALQIYLLECVIAMAQQIEGKDSTFDIQWAKNELAELYQRYRAEHPSEAKPIVGRYWNLGNFRR